MLSAMDSQMVVIGGGPAGSTVASHASGLDTIIVEEHRSIGSPVQCTGLVHPRVVEMASAQETVVNTITGLKMFFPGGRMLEVPSDEAKARVIDRRRFDELLSDRAVGAGARMLTGHRFEGMARIEGGLKVRLRGPEGERFLTTPLLIGADGYRSGVAREAGLDPCREVVRGIQAELDVRLEDQEKVEVYLGKNVAPGFFAWVLPCGDRTRVGLGVSDGNGTPSGYLKALLRRRGLDGAPRISLNAGAIPIGPPKRTCADNVMAVGDAAAQVKPLSGGGLIIGMSAARIAARTAVEATTAGDLSERSLSSYEDAWRADIGREVERGMLIRKVFVGMTDKKLDAAGRMLDRDDAKEVLATGDIDFPSKLARPLLRTVPSLIKFSPHVIGTLLRREQRI